MGTSDRDAEDFASSNIEVADAPPINARVPQIAASISWARRVPNSIKGSSSMTALIRRALWQLGFGS